MKYTPLSIDVNLRPEGFVVHLDSLFAALASLTDRRDARGLRYRLVTVLVYILLAKLAGEDHLRGIAQWVALRKEALAEVLGLAKPQAPHATTYICVLRKAVDTEGLEQVARDFFAGQPKAGASVLINLDGKTLRGTIPAGKTKGVHLLAAYLPEEGWVLFQLEVSRKENEIPKGADGFMSDQQFKTFYWPALKKEMLGLVEEGCIPVMFAEGGHGQRLETIADFPKGKCIWCFDQTDMGLVKEVLGDVCCIAGNIGTALMTAGTPDEVKAYVREVIEVAGRDGGFILTSGCGIDHAKAENVKAFMEAGKEYGIY